MQWIINNEQSWNITFEHKDALVWLMEIISFNKILPCQQSTTTGAMGREYCDAYYFWLWLKSELRLQFTAKFFNFRAICV